MPVSSYGGLNILSLLLMITQDTHVYFIKHKHEVLDNLKEFVNFTTYFTGKQVKTLVIENLVKFALR